MFPSWNIITSATALRLPVLPTYVCRWSRTDLFLADSVWLYSSRSLNPIAKVTMHPFCERTAEDCKSRSNDHRKMVWGKVNILPRVLRYLCRTARPICTILPNALPAQELLQESFRHDIQSQIHTYIMTSTIQNTYMTQFWNSNWFFWYPTLAKTRDLKTFLISNFLKFDGDFNCVP